MINNRKWIRVAAPQEWLIFARHCKCKSHELRSGHLAKKGDNLLCRIISRTSAEELTQSVEKEAG